MSFYPDQDDISLLFQPSKQIYSKVEILNRDYLPVSSIEGILINDSYNVDSTSAVRRTYNCTLQVTSSTLSFDRDNEIWFDKYIRPYIGIYDIRRKKVIWYLKGTYSTLTANHSYDPATNTLSLTCNDLMCRLTGELDGKQTGLSVTIYVGEDIRTSIIQILSVFGFTKYRIADLPRRVQHDLEFGAGAAAADMIKALMEFCPNYEYFFDLDGTFVVQRIPCYTNDGDMLGDEVLRKLLVSQDSYAVKFNAKNCVEVWGKSYDENSIDRVTSDCRSSDGSLYTVRITNGLDGNGDEIEWQSIPDYLLFSVTTPQNITNKARCKIRIDVVEESFGPYTIYDEYDKPLKAGVMEPDTTYIFKHDVKAETLLDSEMRLLGAWDASTVYNYNDVVVWSHKDKDNNDVYDTYIARYSSEVEHVDTEGEGTTVIVHPSFSGVEPKEYDTDHWKKITFASAFELMGVYSPTETYNPTQMVMYDGLLYYCLKNNVVGIAPGSDSQAERPSWDTVNMNVNTIKIENVMRYYGNMTAHGVYKNENDSKFSIAEMGREYWEVLSGGEYDKIASDALALERAMYECYYKSNLSETLSLTLVDIPWLDVNKKVSFKRMLGTEVERWMISSISSDTLNGTCSVTLTKFYPDWAEIYQSAFGT